MNKFQAAIAELFGTEPTRAVQKIIMGALSDFAEFKNVSTPVSFDQVSDVFARSAIPANLGDLEGYFGFVREHIVAHSSNTRSPRCFSHMTPAPPPFMAEIARLVTALNQNLVRADASKALTPVERQTMSMLHRLVYRRDEEFYEESFHKADAVLGTLVSGGTLANLAALWCARNASLVGLDDSVGWVGLDDALEKQGLNGLAVIGPETMHYSFDKAVDLLGIGRENLVRVSTDARQRIEVRSLREAVTRCRREGKLVVAVVAVAGTTDAGAIDPLSDVADVAEEVGVHFHVDAAWGGPLLFSPTLRDRLKGIERASSVTIDGHKQLYAPVGTGVALFREPSLPHVIRQEAPYILRRNSRDLGKYHIEGSRPGTALYLHAALHIIGCSGFTALVEEGIRQAGYAAASIENREEFELLASPETNIVLYRFLPRVARGRHRRFTSEHQGRIDHANSAIHRLQRNRGQSLVSRTLFSLTPQERASPAVALRAVFTNPLTTNEDIELMLDEQSALGLDLE